MNYYQQVFNATHEAILIQDAETERFIDVNRSALEMFELTREEVLDMKVEDSSLGQAPFSQQQATEWFRRALDRGPQIFEWQARKKSGRLFWIEVSLRRSELNGQTCVLALVRDIDQRKQAEQELKQSRQALARAQNLARIGAYSRDYQTGQVHLSPQLCEIIGGEPFSHSLDFFLSRIHPEDKDQVREHIRAAHENERDYDLEYRLVRTDGSICYIHDRAVLERDAEGRPLRVFGTVQDVTDRKTAEMALHESETLYRTLFDTAGVAILLFNNSMVVNCNQQTLNILRCAREDLVGKSVFHQAPEYQPDGRSSVEKGTQLIQAALTGKPQFFEWRHLRKDGEMVDVEVTLNRIDLWEGRYIQAIAHDVTERKQFQGQMRQLRNLLKNIIDSMPSILVGVDSTGRVTHWNLAAQRFTGRTLEEVLDQPFSDYFHDLGPAMERVSAAVADQQLLKLEKEPLNKDGLWRYLDIMAYPLMSDGMCGAVIRMDDVTEQVRIEEVMIQTEKMHTIGALAAGMAHEINNPLGAVLQGAQNIERRLTGRMPANQQVAQECALDWASLQSYLHARHIPDILEGIRESGSRAAHIVSGIVQFGQRGSGHRMQCHPVELIESALELAAKDYDLKKQYDFRSIEIRRELPENLPSVYCIPSEIEQVLINILRNAAQAMMSPPAVDQPMIILRAFRQSRFIRIEIEDNGPGMTEEVRRRVFEPFFTTKEVGIGTGLGLSVASMIVTANHKGALSVESWPGRGSKFMMDLPMEGAV